MSKRAKMPSIDVESIYINLKALAVDGLCAKLKWHQGSEHPSCMCGAALTVPGMGAQ